MKTATSVGWVVRVQYTDSGWMVHDRDGLAPVAPCGATLQLAFRVDLNAAMAHKIALCPKCYDSTVTATRP